MAKFEKPVNSNYCATVVKLSSLVPIEGAKTVQAAMIFSNQVIVSKDTPLGEVGLFFPIETRLSREFLSNNSLYRDPTLNADANKRGYFELNGRIRAVRFMGKHKSEGFFIPLSALDYIGKFDETNLPVGTEFDKLDGHLICEKYVVTTTANARKVARSKADKKLKRISRLVENQFKFHIDTAQLKKEMHNINPTDKITISDKWHGTSWIVGNVLTVRKLSWWEKVAQYFGAKIKDTEYDYICSSRKVVKNQYLNETAGPGFYDYDLWTDIKDRLKAWIPKGFTLYGEAVGYLPTGKMIQKGYHYGCPQNEYRLFVYRITFTNEDGKTYELSDDQIAEFCRVRGLSSKKIFYSGTAADLFPDLKQDEHWHENWLKALSARSDFNLNDVMCPNNNNAVPAEGVVLRVDSLESFDAYKLKNWRFFEYETKLLDAGESDLESDQVVDEDEN